MAMEGAVGAVAAGVAAGAFGYNRENYMYDAEMRFERFASAREYANQQAEQYRGDLRSLAALTIKKNTVWTVTATLCMALDIALYCAGRLGLHGPSPPSWIMGLWMTNNAASFAFMALCVFLSMHCAFRAQAASTHLLTRKVRVPVPTLKMLDDARPFGSEFEQQSWGDIFRVPFMTNNGAPKTDEADFAGESSAGGSSKRAQSAPGRRDGGSRSKCSSWIREEFQTLRAGTVDGSKVDLPEDAAPEHFELYAACQKEFYQHDIYSRVCIFYGFIHYFQSLCFYGLGHINIEIRAFWVSYACVGVIAVLNCLIIRFEIIPSNSNKKQYLRGCQYCGVLAVLSAAIGMSLDFRVEFDPNMIALSWGFVFLAYIFQLLYALRLLEVVLPDTDLEGLTERLGASFLPEGWTKIPSSFSHVYYFVAPPTKLQPGQNDIVREIKQGGGGAYDEVVGNSPKSSHAAAEVPKESDDRKYHESMPQFAFDKHVAPWKMVASIQFVLPCAWCFLILGTIVDVIIGDQALVTAPHWSRPPMTRLSLAPHELGTPLGFPWAAGEKAFIPEQMAWHEEKHHADQYSFGRRLQGVAQPSSAGFSDVLSELLSAIPSADEAAASQSTRAEEVSWPAFFEPKLMACGPSHDPQSSLVATLTQRGFGSVARVGAGGVEEAETFKLAGLTNLPPLVGVSWGADTSDGLLLISKAGHLVNCPGVRPAAGGIWQCGPAQRLPILEGSKLLAGAAARLAGPGGAGGQQMLHVAVVHEGAPDLVAIFMQEGDAWAPLGEVMVPRGRSRRAAGKISLAFVDGDLLVTTADGQVLRRRLHDGAVVVSAVHALGGEEWHAACGLHHNPAGSVAHLRLRKSSSAHFPEVLTTSMALLPGTKSAAAPVLA